ncbi:hypothetical protein FNV43_RR08812 [Rhamnella rubrinervis]|uniref:Uncharacterized protein n=1 Tax=Rhamnella rubrinervis TaxID=2594499 RepID=A0A8K0MJE7_9ROSA|nr:hypothetical protein FNV43_RR08812 [Rhamnella rubrinervis]
MAEQNPTSHIELDVAPNQSARLSTSTEQNASIDALCTIGKSLNILFSAKLFRSAGYWPPRQKAQEVGPSYPQAELIPEGIPHPFIEVPYTHVLEGCIRLLYGEPTDTLWAFYPTVDMGKMKVAPPTAEQFAKKERKRREKKSMRKTSGSIPSKKLEPTPGGTITVQPKDLVLTTTAERSPSQKKQRRSSPPTTMKGKEPLAPKASLGLEDSSSIRSDANLFAPVVGCLMTRHDRSILKSMPLEDICQEVKQGTLKLAQTSRYLYEAVVKVDNAFKKQVHSVHKQMSGRPEAWPGRRRKRLYTAKDAYLRAQKEMILKFKAGQTSWRTPEPSEDEGDDGVTSEISSNESEHEPDQQLEDLCCLGEECLTHKRLLYCGNGGCQGRQLMPRKLHPQSS